MMQPSYVCACYNAITITIAGEVDIVMCEAAEFRKSNSRKIQTFIAFVGTVYEYPKN